MSKKHNITIGQGADFTLPISITRRSTGLPFDLTGYTVSSMVRPQYSSGAPIVVFGISGSLDSTGSFALTISGSVTLALPSTCAQGPSFLGFYDVFIHAPSGLTPAHILEGVAILQPTATK
jgi:hypothetical protein